MDLSACSFMDLDQDSLSGVDADGISMDHDHVKWQGSQTANQALNQLIRTSVNDPVLAVAKENVDVNGSSTRSWQREPSFDQIPGFSLLSTKDSNSGSLSSSSASSSIFQTPQPTTKPLIPRPRPSEVKASRSTPSLAGPSNNPLQPLASSSSTPSLNIPFFDKTNPSQFLDILRGVSARVDANAGVRPRSSTGGIDTLPSRVVKGKKRPRGFSLGGTSDTLATRLKRGRVEALRESGGVNPKAKDRDKGKGRVRSEVEDGGGIFGDSASVQHDTVESLQGRTEVCRMDVDHDSDGNINLGHSLDNSACTSSQTEMPPPPVPAVKHPSVATSRLSPTSTSSASTAPSTSLSRLATTSHPTYTHHQPTSRDINTPTTSQTTKYHPLLLQPPAKTSSSVSTSSTLRQSNAQPKHPPLQPKPDQGVQLRVKTESRQERHVPTPAPVPAVLQTTKPQPSSALPPPPSSSSAPLPSSTPQVPSSQCSRPPALGMRRTHTLPSSSAFSSSSSDSGKLVPSLQKSGMLPTKQRGFKPPLLSSQPSRSQAANSPSACLHPTTIADHHVPSTTKRSEGRVSLTTGKAPLSRSRSRSSSNTSNSPQQTIGPPSSSLSRSTSGSPAPSTSSASSFSISVTTTSPRTLAGSRASPSHSSATGKQTAKDDNKSNGRNRTANHGQWRNAPINVSPKAQSAPRPESRTTKKEVPAPPPPPPQVVQVVAAVPKSPPIPEPGDGDPDSSFGDISFDLDALEETMRQYD